jgi:hypothetical protein
MIADQLLLMVNRSQSLTVVDPFVGERVISCAAALFKLRPVFVRFGGPVERATFPKVAGPDLTHMSFPSGERVTREHDELFVSFIEPATNRTGQTRERVLPRVGESGYQAACSDQTVETQDGPPHQLMVRLGRGPIVPHAPRRALEDGLS